MYITAGIHVQLFAYRVHKSESA